MEGRKNEIQRPSVPVAMANEREEREVA